MRFTGTENILVVGNGEYQSPHCQLSTAKFLSFFFLLTTVVLLGSCTPKNPARTTDTNTQPQPIPESDITVKAPEEEEVAPPPPPPPPLPFVVMRLEKTACYGRCPIFELKLFSDGRAEYHGKANTQRLGVYESRVTKAFIDLVLHEAEKISYFQLNDHYPLDGRFISDLPNTTTYIKKSGKEKSIIRNHNGPLLLRKYETFLIECFEALNWEPLSYE